jgi:predicted RND superfamily exporter protein
MSRPTFYGRYGLIVLVIVVFLLPFTFRGARLALKSNHNDVKEWLPDEYVETQEFNWFRKYFAGEQFVLVSWEGCTLDDVTKLETLKADLLKPSRDKNGDLVYPKHDPQKVDWLISEIVTGPDLIKQLMNGKPRGMSYAEAHERLNGLFIGPDKKTTCMVITLSDYGAEHLRDVVNVIRDRAKEVASLSKEDLKMGGPPVDNVALDEEGESALIRLAAFSVLVGLIVSWWCLRSMPLVMMVFITGIYGGMIALALVYYTGGTMNAILLTMPSLVYVAATSGAIHLANYYREGVLENGVRGAPVFAVRHAILPLSLATGTTTVGLLSLYISELVPIKTFGLYSAVGVTATLFPLLVVLPSMLELWPVTRTSSFKEFLLFFPRMFYRPIRYVFRKITGSAEPAVKREVDERPQRDSWVNPIELLPWGGIGESVIRHHFVWIGGLTIVMIICGFGLTKVETSINLMRFFSADSKIRRDYAWLEEHLGPLVPMEVIVEFSPNSGLNMLERMELIAHVHREVVDLPEVGSAMSAVTFVPDLPKGSGYSIERGSWNRNLSNERGRSALEGSGYLTVGEGEDAGQDLWRVSARVQALKDMDYKAFVDDIRRRVDPVVDAINAKAIAVNVQRSLLETSGFLPPREVTSAVAVKTNDAKPDATTNADSSRASLISDAFEPPVKVVYTGLVPLVYQAQQSLMEGLKIGFVGDWILIAIVMMIVVRDVSAGFLLMIPSAFPALIVFGVMGLMGIVVDTGTVMAPAVALGVTVDDVVHFMLKFADKIRAGGTRREAIMAAYKHCAQPIYQSWGVIGLGLSVFALSHFMPTQRFGWMMITLLTASTIGNLTLLPAILASPLGSIFVWSIRRQARKNGGEPGHSEAGELVAESKPVHETAEVVEPVAEHGHNGRPVLPHSKLRDSNVRHDAPHMRKH